MKRTPEGTLFSGIVAHRYIHGEWEKARQNLEQVPTVDSLRRERRLMPIAQQLSKLGGVLVHEVAINQVIKYGMPGEEEISLRKAIDSFLEQPISNEHAYVALSVVEDYLNEHTKTPEKTQHFRERFITLQYSEHSDGQKTDLEPDIVREGVIFLREGLESKLTVDELERVRNALR